MVNTTHRGSAGHLPPAPHYSASVLHAGSREQMPGRVILVRHGRTRNNRIGRMQGWDDIPLDQRGLWQVKKAGQALRDIFVDQPASHGNPRKQLVVSSDLSRARQSAQAFADPLHLTIHLDQRLEERYFGEWEGMTTEEIKQTASRDYYSWITHHGGELRHGFEPESRTSARGEAALEQWAARCDPSTDLFLFMHGSIIQVTLERLLGCNMPTGWLGMTGMANAHWAVIAPTFVNPRQYLWTLVTYNQGPAASQNAAAWDGE